MYALKDGYLIRLLDRENHVVWDAENHDMTLCHQVMQEIRTEMEEKRPPVKGVNFQRTAMIYGKGMPLWGIWM